ncbi:MAG: ABC transporter ATP-binding protein [Acholeplasmatales bacterium]|jgi:multidrug/hemolysin transport system ATP-binding protein|nr:ABC transporter ATP-binding protein [Acholeplasmatales bacterium]
MKYIIETKNLSKSFGELKAVNNISFKVKKGGLFAFLGLNGAGKSTTINMLCQIINKDHGEIIINKCNIDNKSETIKKDIGIVFQSSVLDPELTVLQNLISRASLYNLSKEKTKKRLNYLIDIFNLEDILNRPYGVLSGGQRRKTDIARALIHEPKILFLDEPTAGLDPIIRNQVWHILTTLMHENDLTIFLTTHYMEEVLNSNYVVILDEGNIVAEGTPDNLKDLYASDLLRVLSKKSADIEALFNKNNIKYTYKNECYYINLDNPREAYEIINLNPDLLNNFEVIKGNMDQVFLNVTGKELGEENGKV